MRGLALLLAAAPLWAAPAAGRTLVHAEARFSMAAPKGWRTAKLSSTETGTGTSGAVFTAPRPKAPPARIVVVFYQAGNPHFKDAADFLRRQTAPMPVPVEGERTGPVEDARLGTLPAERLTRDSLAAVPARAVEAREVPVREVVTAAQADGGFYAVTCSGPAAEWKRLEPLFKEALASFRALPKGP